MWTTLLLQGGRPSTQANVVLSFSFTLLNVSENQVRVLVIISFCLICSMAARALSSKVFPNSFSLSGKLSNVLDKSGAAWAGTGPAARGLQANPLAWGWVLDTCFYCTAHLLVFYALPLLGRLANPKGWYSRSLVTRSFLDRIASCSTHLNRKERHSAGGLGADRRWNGDT